MPISPGFACTPGNGHTQEALMPARYWLVISDFVGGSWDCLLWVPRPKAWLMCTSSAIPEWTVQWALRAAGGGLPLPRLAHMVTQRHPLQYMGSQLEVVWLQAVIPVGCCFYSDSKPSSGLKKGETNRWWMSQEWTQEQFTCHSLSLATENGVA